MGLIAKFKRFGSVYGEQASGKLQKFIDRIQSDSSLHCEEVTYMFECGTNRMFILCSGNDAVVLYIDRNGSSDELADEEIFDGAPLWFSEYSHRESPFYTVMQAAKHFMCSCRDGGYSAPTRVMPVLVTNSHIINFDDYNPEFRKLGGVVIPDIEAIELNETNDWGNGFQVVAKFKKDVKDGVYKNDEFATEQITDVIEMPEEDYEEDDSTEAGISTDEIKVTDPETLPLPPISVGNVPVKVLPCLADPDKKFKKMVGLVDVRGHLSEAVAFGRYTKKTRILRPEVETPMNMNLHTILIGNPGSGKTTMAQYYASKLRAAGLLTHGHTILATRSAFIGQNFGFEEERMREILNLAEGGVLFIDEAGDMINHPHPHDPARAVFALLLQMLADESHRDIAVVLALYNNTDLEKLFSFNPGFQSRFVNILHLPDYTLHELEEIARRRARGMGLKFTPKAWRAFREHLTKLYQSKDAQWGNARSVNNLLEKVLKLHAVRCDRRGIDGDGLFKIIARDIPQFSLPEKAPRKKVGF